MGIGVPGKGQAGGLVSQGGASASANGPDRVVMEWNLGPGTTVLRMPSGWLLLRVGVIDGVVRLWALVDPEAPSVDVEIRCYETGARVPFARYRRYLGTVGLLDQSEPAVFHFFEECGDA